MLKVLSEFDPITAAGILARAAVFVDDESNSLDPGAVENERSIRDQVISTLRIRLGVSEGELSADSRRRLSEAMDQESEQLLTDPDVDAALDRLGSKGLLPSDLYEIHYAGRYPDLMGAKFYDEDRLIRLVVRRPQQEQHLGAGSAEDESGDDEQFTLVSLFSRFFPHAKYPGRGFTLLVVAQRRGQKLTVIQAWRLYGDSIDVSNAASLMDVWRKFILKFGVKIRVNHFEGEFVFAELPLVDGKLTYEMEIVGRPERKDDELTGWQFGINRHGLPARVIAMAVDMSRYLRDVGRHRWVFPDLSSLDAHQL